MSDAPYGVWAKISAPLPTTAIAWRADGKPTARDGRFFARYVPYVESNTVRERLDSTVPGDWNVTMELLPSVPYTSEEDMSASFKARLQILGVIREGIGTGRDYKSAATDAFKRAAVQFGIGSELYDFDMNWVQVDGDGKYAKPVEDPQKAYERRHSGAEKGVGAEARSPTLPAGGEKATPAPSPTLTDGPEPVSCPKCGGRMWDNRLTKRNAKAPDYKCQNRSCDGVIWPPKDNAPKDTPASSRRIDDDDIRGSLEAVDEDDRTPLPF